MIIAILSLSSALADQCAWIPKANADKAVTYLKPGTIWASYCEPCGDTAPVFKTVVQTPVIRPTSSGLFEVVVDGEAIDLAYVFTVRKDSDTRLGNLAHLAGCPASDVSKTIARPVTPSR